MVQKMILLPGILLLLAGVTSVKSRSYVSTTLGEYGSSTDNAPTAPTNISPTVPALEMTTEESEGSFEEEAIEKLEFKIDSRSDERKFTSMMKNIHRLANGDYLYQRDIRIGEKQLRQLYGVDESGDERSYLWPNASIPYKIGRKVTQFADQIRSAMKQWEKSTCVRFHELRKAAHTSDYVNFVRAHWAYSYLGKQGGRQRIGVPSTYFPDTHYAHLLGHAMGLRHTQAAADRDVNFLVARHSVPSRYRYNYDSEGESYASRTRLLGLESESGFDWNSAMDYLAQDPGAAGYVEAEDDKVLYPMDPFYLHQTLHTEEPGFIDIKKLNMLYRCNERCSNLKSTRCFHGGYLGPSCTCVCPADAIGDHCEHKTATKKGMCGEVITENATVHFTASEHGSSHCTWWIRGPEGSRTGLTFTSISVDNARHGPGSCDLQFELRSHDMYKGERLCWYEISKATAVYARGHDFLIDYFGPVDANFNFTLAAFIVGTTE
uniref:Metalloendopeptidase n=2 Tax=Ixodes ricinus TaxID=34613 RepID=V5GPZ9_IXORI